MLAVVAITSAARTGHHSASDWARRRPARVLL